MLHVCIINAEAISMIVEFVKEKYGVVVPDNSRKLVSFYSSYDREKCESKVVVTFTGETSENRFQSDKIQIPQVSIDSIYGHAAINLKDRYCNNMLTINLD